MRKISFFISISILMSCASGKLMLNAPGDPIQEQPQEEPAFTIYALGDAGEINHQSKAVLAELNAITSDDHQEGLVIFLGDNIYPAGLPAEDDPEENQEGKNILSRQVQAIKNYKGQIIFIPGNHDWNEFKTGGLEAVKREGDFLDQVDPSHVRFLPKNGCGGP
ncbi:MAG: metallophosphoesterase, partial [Saprospiraceae bacterium]